jgi:plastocyanin
METDEEEYSSKWILIILVAASLLILAGVAAALAIPLQPSLHGGSTSVSSGTVVMPAGVGTNLKLNFYPAVVTVVLGQNSTVTWDNQDTATHTVTATDGSFNSGDIKPGTSWSYTFSAPGNYTYYCLYHTAWMKGTVVVVSS